MIARQRGLSRPTPTFRNVRRWLTIPSTTFGYGLRIFLRVTLAGGLFPFLALSKTFSFQTGRAPLRSIQAPITCGVIRANVVLSCILSSEAIACGDIPWPTMVAAFRIWTQSSGCCQLTRIASTGLFSAFRLHPMWDGTCHWSSLNSRNG